MLANLGDRVRIRIANTALRAILFGITVTMIGLGPCEPHTYTVKAHDSVGERQISDPVATGTTESTGSPLPKHFLTGYWHNFDNGTVEQKLSAVPDEYDLIAVAFGEATSTPGQVAFAVDPGLSASLGGYTDAQFKTDVQTLHARGKKVILSVGGEAGHVQVSSASAATTFAKSVYAIMRSYGFDGVDIDLENELSSANMADALRQLRAKAGSGLIITMAPQTIDMQSTGDSLLRPRAADQGHPHRRQHPVLQLGPDARLRPENRLPQGTVDFIVALACIQLENGLRPDQVGLGLPAGPAAAGRRDMSRSSVVNEALDCLTTRTNCGSFVPPHAYPGIRGVMTWSINWDASNGWNFCKTVKPHLATLP